MVALDCGRQLAFALGGGLFVEFARPQLGQQTGFFHRTLEAAHRHFEWLIFLDTNRRHKKYCPEEIDKNEGRNSSNNPLICKHKQETVQGPYRMRPAIPAPNLQAIPKTQQLMLVLGIETSCDETGVALFDTRAGLLGHTLFSQVAMHAEYGGVVPELASRDHIRRLLPLIRQLLGQTGRALNDIDGIAYTQGPGLAGALLVGASVAASLGFALGVPAIGLHHLEGHLLSPLLTTPAPRFPFVALLVSGGHTQLMKVGAVGDYELLGETVDDAAGEAFDKTAKLLGLPYPGGPALAKLADSGNPKRFKLPRPMMASGDLNFSFSGLKTAALTLASREDTTAQNKADIAAAFQNAIVEVLVAKSTDAVSRTGLDQLVVAGGVGANQRLREALAAKAASEGFEVFYPPLDLCTDNGAMIAFAGAQRLEAGVIASRGFSVRPRWELEELRRPALT